MGDVKLHLSDLPKCETCDHYKNVRRHRGICEFITDEAFVTIENADNVPDIEEVLDVLVERIKLAPLSSFGCRFHSEIEQGW